MRFNSGARGDGWKAYDAYGADVVQVEPNRWHVTFGSVWKPTSFDRDILADTIEFYSTTSWYAREKAKRIAALLGCPYVTDDSNRF